MNVPPVIPTPPEPPTRGPNILLTILGLAFLLVILVTGLLAYGVTSYLRLGAEARALRNSFTQTAHGGWHKRLEINVGGFTTGLARAGLGFAQIDGDVRAALGGMRAGQVGIYELGAGANPDPAKAFAAADDAMYQRGWDRLAVVSRQDTLVTVYVPLALKAGDELSACFVVLHDRQLVLGSVRGDLEPLLQLAQNHAPARETRSNQVHLAVVTEAGATTLR